MDVTPILDPLNDAQREAVAAEAPAVLVLAGAGSGKTRVLVHRIAWQIQVADVSPFSILAVTFTNKAAGEMRGRIEQLLGAPAGAMWVGTFHSIAHRLLRMHWREAGLPQTFQILDSEDQLRVVRRVLKNMELDDSRWPPKQLQWFINSKKDEGLRPKHLGGGADPVHRQMVRVYEAYQQHCDRAGLVDFAELLLRAHELWLNNPDVLDHYRQRFRHILVDEFQDTNTIQYAWVRLLAGETGQPFVVGDDDQSIYGWRGARIENIHKFEKDFSAVKVVRLEQNYRSTGNILAAANAVIANNSERMGKNLWTSGEDGDPIRLYAAYNEQDEAQFVIAQIRQWISDGNARSDAAVLYRSNAQSRMFEEALMNAGIPYRVYGGLRFFERQEIKDALAYLRLLENQDDDASFERVVNLPPRGIGARTLDQVREHARAQAVSLWRAAEELIKREQLSARAAGALRNFVDLMEEMRVAVRDLALYEQIDHVIQGSGLIAHYSREKGERGETRVENLEELVNAGRGFVLDDMDELPPLAAFLSHAALEAGEGQADEWEDCIQLMTMHSVKGLEFPLVFICGMEDGLFPHQRSIEDPSGIEEERRLCYVGMTRARQHLYMTYAEQRRLYNTDTYGVPSRFLREIPAELVYELRPKVQVSRPARSGRSRLSVNEAPPGIRLGARVTHPKFGEGIVLNYEGAGSQARVQVNFEAAGTKWLVVAFANLAIV
ncbi:MAG: DNA helicase II [Gammaproteobacteria bacterium]|nr:DNA helicase II [Gammaproteobacteria bacterium]